MSKGVDLGRGRVHVPELLGFSIRLTRAKNARTITFQQFQEAMKELSQKRFKDKKPDEALENIYKLMEGKDPATTGVTVSGSLHPSPLTLLPQSPCCSCLPSHHPCPYPLPLVMPEGDEAKSLQCPVGIGAELGDHLVISGMRSLLPREESTSTLMVKLRLVPKCPDGSGGTLSAEDSVPAPHSSSCSPIRCNL